MILDLGEFLDPLARTPALLRSVVNGVSESWLDRRHAPDVVSPRLAVAHLLRCEVDESWIMRIQFVRGLLPEIPAGVYDGLSGAQMVGMHTVSELLDEFEAARQQNLRDLVALQLTTADLQCSFTEPDFGTQTVAHLLATWVAHDLYHLGQIFKSYSAPYVDQIGPFQYFLNLPHFN